jgi:hypothetical protein
MVDISKGYFVLPCANETWVVQSDRLAPSWQVAFSNYFDLVSWIKWKHGAEALLEPVDSSTEFIFPCSDEAADKPKGTDDGT